MVKGAEIVNNYYKRNQKQYTIIVVPARSFFLYLRPVIIPLIEYSIHCTCMHIYRHTGRKAKVSLIGHNIARVLSMLL